MILNRDDFARWAEVLSCLPPVGDDFMQWVIGPLRLFFPFERVYMAHGMLVAGEVTITHWQADGHEGSYTQQLALTFELEKRTSLGWWLKSRAPFFIDPSNPPPFASGFEVNEIKSFELKNVAAHGVLNLRANAGTYFSFSGVRTPMSEWHLDALKILTPVLNDLYLEKIAAADSVPNQLTELSSRQRAIARLVVAGHDDKSIARELGIAAQTVKNQLSTVYQSLGIRTRTQLIAMLR